LIVLIEIRSEPVMHVVIPDNDPLIPLLEQRAMRRGVREKDKRKLRKRLPKLARALISERLGELANNGDPFELSDAHGSMPRGSLATHPT
jgi:hypothetical protein